MERSKVVIAHKQDQAMVAHMRNIRLIDEHTPRFSRASDAGAAAIGVHLIVARSDEHSGVSLREAVTRLHVYETWVRNCAEARRGGGE